ncbi:oxidoreductase [Nonomuraea sp. B5E05]|uniref:oxidoreductase n=1 Tax=Nonomuraea sp. B5E05 TaxID=3153569 RepID=UPI003261CEC2
MTFSAEPSLPDQSGRLALVTGANSGLGYVTARELARHGAHVVLACRDPGRGQAALARLRDEVPGARAELRRVDLAKLASIREFAAQWDHDRLDLLVNNAGVAIGPLTRTEDGFERQFGTNHLGTFALTGGLLPQLLAAPEPRVVTVSSEVQRFCTFNLDNLNAERGYNTFVAYMRSKRANLYFAMELQRRADAAGQPLRSMAVVPELSRTNVFMAGVHSSKGRLYRTLVRMMLRVAFRPAESGARPSLHAATAANLPGGSFIVPRGPFHAYGSPTRCTRAPGLHDAATAERLWQLSEKLTGVAYRWPEPASG